MKKSYVIAFFNLTLLIPTLAFAKKVNGKWGTVKYTIKKSDHKNYKYRLCNKPLPSGGGTKCKKETGYVLVTGSNPLREERWNNDCQPGYVKSGNTCIQPVAEVPTWIPTNADYNQSDFKIYAVKYCSDLTGVNCPPVEEGYSITPNTLPVKETKWTGECHSFYVLQNGACVPPTPNDTASFYVDFSTFSFNRPSTPSTSGDIGSYCRSVTGSAADPLGSLLYIDIGSSADSNPFAGMSITLYNYKSSQGGYFINSSKLGAGEKGGSIELFTSNMITYSDEVSATSPTVCTIYAATVAGRITGSFSCSVLRKHNYGSGAMTSGYSGSGTFNCLLHQE